MKDLRIPTLRGRFGTTTNGTYVPDAVPFDEPFWRMIGLWLAEGHIGADGARRRVCWSFNPDRRGGPGRVRRSVLVRTQRVKVSVLRMSTTMQVSISSRLLAAWFEHVLGTGHDCYDKRLPDAIWSASDADKRALLRGLWDGDGSWSPVNGGPSWSSSTARSAERWPTAWFASSAISMSSPASRSGARRRAPATRTGSRISGADQIESALWLLPPAERAEVGRSTGRQTKRIAPTGYRRLTQKHAAWVRVARLERRPYAGTVYSPRPCRRPTPSSPRFGLMTHQCFPKDSRALVRIAEDAGYDFDLLKGVITVNEEQFDRVAARRPSRWSAARSTA